MLPIGQVKHISVCESWVQLAKCSPLEYNEWALPCTGREYTQLLSADPVKNIREVEYSVTALKESTI